MMSKVKIRHDKLEESLFWYPAGGFRQSAGINIHTMQEHIPVHKNTYRTHCADLDGVLFKDRKLQFYETQILTEILVV